MTRSAGKRGARTQAVPSAPPAKPINGSSAPPAPFQLVPASLRNFVSTLPDNHIYLVHLDPTPIQLKRRVFLVPVLLNLILILILCVRIYYAAPVYLQQLITIFGYETSWTVNAKSSSAGDLMSTVTSRTLLLMIDYGFFVLLGSWPREFIFGSKASRFVGALDWRWTSGFQDTEVIVRRGRIWDTPLLEEVAEGKRAWALDEELTIKYKIEPAMRKAYTSKTGYLLLDKDWDLDFRGMIDAHRLAADGRVKLEDLDDVAFVFYRKQWLLWKVHEHDKLEISDPAQEEKLERFKSKLTEMGCENVFFRWIEIVQYETSQPAGFTESKQAEAIGQLKRMMEERGVDYAQFWTDIDGERGLPGLER